jgi:lysophospholipase L1-like esterase
LSAAGGATGGAPNPGGASATGGTTPAGGASGGSSAKGGSTAVGGTTTTGGTTDTGSSTGGSKPVGGASGETTAGGASGAGGSTHTGKWKFMPLGDSITADTCYPKFLAQEFTAKGRTNYQFVGTFLNNQPCNGAANVQTEGHGGYLVTFLTTNEPSRTGLGTLNELTTWAAEKPDIVLMHYGTNDVWSSVKSAEIVSAYLFVINQFRSQNPTVIFFVSKIIPMNPSGCGNCTSGVAALDALLTATWASTNSTPTSPIYIVDQSATINTGTDTADGVHPNAAGAQKMADVAYTAIAAQNYF